MITLSDIIPNPDINLPLSAAYLDYLTFFQKEQGKWYIKSHDFDGKDKLVYNENNGKKAPEEIVRQLFILELKHKYGYPVEKIKIEQSVSFGIDDAKRADVIVYQDDLSTPWIIAEIKSPYQKNSIQQLKSYLNAQGSPIGLGFNGKNVSRYIRPYPKEFEILTDLPFEHEYQLVKKSDNVIKNVKEVIADRKWTLAELNKLNSEKRYDLRAIIEELEELVLGNSGVESFHEIFKLIYTKLYDEFEAVNRDNETLFFRDYSDPKITYAKISELFEEAKREEWKSVFEPTEVIKLTPNHLEICIAKLAEVKLFGSNLRIIDEAFEFLVTEVAKGKKGQYFTPRVVIDFCVKVLNPKRREYILDPACGSAGFLVHSMEYVWEKYGLKDYRSKSNYSQKYLWGIDFDERSTKTSRAIMLIAGDGKTHIYQQNTLEYEEWSPSIRADMTNERLMSSVDDSRDLKFDIVMSNPPFSGEVKEKNILKSYSDILDMKYSYKIELTCVKTIFDHLSKRRNIMYSDNVIDMVKTYVKSVNKNKDIDLELDDELSRIAGDISKIFHDEIISGSIEYLDIVDIVTDLLKFKKTPFKWSKVDRHILFVQRIINMIKEGGRGVIVLPQGIFNNQSLKFVRKYIADKSRVLGIVSLHGNSFKPHTGTKTTLIFIKKYTKSELESSVLNSNYPIYFGVSIDSFKNNSGNYLFDSDVHGQVVVDVKGNPVYKSDLDDIFNSFVSWGKSKFEHGDKSFEFMSDISVEDSNFKFSEISLNSLSADFRLDAEYYQPKALEVIRKIKSIKHVRLGDIAKVVNGFPWKSEYFSETEGEPFIRIRDCKPVVIINDDLTMLDKDYASSIGIEKAEIGDIVIGMDGLKYFYASLVTEPAYVNQRVCQVRVNANSPVTSNYVAFVVNSQVGQTQLLKEMTIADTVGHITNVNVMNLLIPIYDEEEQVTIEKNIQKSIDSVRAYREALSETTRNIELYIG